MVYNDSYISIKYFVRWSTYRTGQCENNFPPNAFGNDSHQNLVTIIITFMEHRACLFGYRMSNLRYMKLPNVIEGLLYVTVQGNRGTLTD